MTQETSPAPDWYQDPESPGQLRYWDGQEWTEHRSEHRAEAAAGAKPAKTPKAPKAPKVTKEPGQEGEQSFTLVVLGVLGAALALIMFIAIVVIASDSYNTGKARGEQAKDGGVDPATASQYCEATAKNVSATGSAAGYWDFAWIMGCKSGLS